MKKLDNSEFIARYQDKVDIRPAHRKGWNFDALYTALVVLLLSGTLFGLIYDYYYAGSVVTNLIAFVTALAALIIFVAYRSVRAHSGRDRQLDIMCALLDGSRGARMITNLQGKSIYTNGRFKEMFADAGAPGLETLKAVFGGNEETAAHFRLLSDQAARGLGDTIELTALMHGEDSWLEVTAQPVQGFEGYVHWRIDDITQQYALDRTIREEREKLIDFTDNAPVGFFSLNQDGRFVFANATFARWVGEDLQSLLEHGSLHTYLVEPPEGSRPFDLVADGRPRQVVEMQMKGAAGSTFLASINQVVVEEPDGRVRTRAVVHDLTTEREMYRALQVSEDRFQRFFEEAPLGIILLDSETRIVNTNTMFAAMLGRDVGAIEGQTFADFINEEYREGVLAAIAGIEQGSQMEAPIEVLLQDKDGGPVQTQMHARRFRESGEIVLHFIDQREKKALEEQFVQSQKMQAIGQLAGGVAHDFNNLLTAIIGFCDLLLLRHKPGDPSFSDIMQIKQNSNRASNLVRQLLAFSRQQTLRPRVHDIANILTEVSHLLRRLIGASIELNLVHGSELGLVKVDEGQMEQVLINLAVNARDAMNGMGELVIETENYTNRKPRELASEELPAGHWVLIKVKDTGCGIPKENISRIFEPFFTTKEVGAGTGLGLATVYGIIRQTDGYLDVESKVGAGTTFYIYLPRSLETEEEASPEKHQEEKTKDLTGTEKILLVEDEDAVRTFSQRALTNKGYQVLAAESGDAALALLEKEENQQLDLLITDVVMPNMDGPTLAQRVRQNSRNLKIIFISGYTEDKLKDYMGPNIWFLPKPFTLKQLAEKVKDVLEE